MKRLLATICFGGITFLSYSPAIQAQPQEIDEVVKARGTLEPIAVVDVCPQVTGTVKALELDPNSADKKPDFGAHVDKGTVLAEIEPKTYQLALEQAKAGITKAEAGLRLAKAKLDLAKLNFARAGKSASDKPADALDEQVARAGLDVAEAEVENSAAELQLRKTAADRAALDLEHCTIRSPVDGVIIARRGEVGQTVMPQQGVPSMFLIATDLKRMQLWIDVDEHQIAKVTPGQPVKFNVVALPDAHFTGKVVQIRPNAQAVQNTVFYTVVADVDQIDGKLLPYMTAEAEIVTAKHLANR
jgi:HlyD family secretion protein